MRVVVEHNSTQAEVIRKVDSASDQMMNVGIKNVQIVDQKKSWTGPVMDFSFTGKMGFISLPLAGTVAVDDKNITLDCELPSLLKNLMGEEKVRATVEQNIQKMVA